MLSLVRILTAAMLLLLTSAATAVAQSGKIIIGVIPELNLVKQMDRFVPLSDYLEKKTGFGVDIKPLSNYGQIYEEMRDGNIDAGFFGSFVYIITRARIDIEPLVRPVLPNGKSTYTGVLFVRKDAGIKNPADMKGKTIALVDPATTGGYLAQREYLEHHGINIDTDMKIHWAGSHEAAIKAVLSNQAQIGGAKSTVVAKFRKENSVFDTVVDIISETPKQGVPDNTLAARKGLDPGKRDLLRKTLLAMGSDPEGKKVLAKFGAAKFVTTIDNDFKPLYDLVKHLRIDLKTYPYKKEPTTSTINKASHKDVK